MSDDIDTIIKRLDAFGPPSLKMMSFKSGRTSNLTGAMDSITLPSAKASRISFADTLRGPCVPGSSSEKHITKKANARPDEDRRRPLDVAPPIIVVENMEEAVGRIDGL